MRIYLDTTSLSESQAFLRLVQSAFVLAQVGILRDRQNRLNEELKDSNILARTESWAEERDRIDRYLHEMMNDYEMYSRDQYARILAATDFAGARPIAALEFNTFNDWIQAHLDPDLIQIHELRAPSSVEFVLHVAAMSGMVLLQSHPTIKDIYEYATHVLNEWLTEKPRKTQAEIPPLPPAYKEVFAQFETVTMSWDGSRNQLSLTAKNRRPKPKKYMDRTPVLPSTP